MSILRSYWVEIYSPLLHGLNVPIVRETVEARSEFEAAASVVADVCSTHHGASVVHKVKVFVRSMV